MSLPELMDHPSQVASVLRVPHTGTAGYRFQTPTGLWPDRHNTGYWLADGLDQVRHYRSVARTLEFAPEAVTLAGNLHLRFESKPGTGYRLFSWQDLRQWSAGETMCATGTKSVFNAPISEKTAFFRAVAQP